MSFFSKERPIRSFNNQFEDLPYEGDGGLGDDCVAFARRHKILRAGDTAWDVLYSVVADVMDQTGDPRLNIAGNRYLSLVRFAKIKGSRPSSF